MRPARMHDAHENFPSFKSIKFFVWPITSLFRIWRKTICRVVMVSTKLMCPKKRKCIRGSCPRYRKEFIRKWLVVNNKRMISNHLHFINKQLLAPMLVTFLFCLRSETITISRKDFLNMRKSNKKELEIIHK